MILSRGVGGGHPIWILVLRQLLCVSEYSRLRGAASYADRIWLHIPLPSDLRILSSRVTSSVTWNRKLWFNIHFFSVYKDFSKLDNKSGKTKKHARILQTLRPYLGRICKIFSSITSINNYDFFHIIFPAYHYLYSDNIEII